MANPNTPQTGSSGLPTGRRDLPRSPQDQLDDGRIESGPLDLSDTTPQGSSSGAMRKSGDEAFHNPASSAERAATSPQPTTGGARIEGSPAALQSDGPGPFLMLADTLTGDSVVNLAGEDLGDIQGFMLDVRRGSIAYAVLSVGGFLGLGNHLFAIPWSALTLDADNERFILNITHEYLENAPGFDKDHWPDMADPQWASQIHDYYGSSPYWKD